MQPGSTVPRTSRVHSCQVLLHLKSAWWFFAAEGDGEEGEDGGGDEDCGAEFKPLVQLDEVEVQVGDQRLARALYPTPSLLLTLALALTLTQVGAGLLSCCPRLNERSDIHLSEDLTCFWWGGTRDAVVCERVQRLFV